MLTWGEAVLWIVKGSALHQLLRLTNHSMWPRTVRGVHSPAPFSALYTLLLWDSVVMPATDSLLFSLLVTCVLLPQYELWTAALETLVYSSNIIHVLQAMTIMISLLVQHPCMSASRIFFHRTRAAALPWNVIALKGLSHYKTGPQN